jgi:putative transposase
MSKIARYYENRAVYFITTNTYAGRELFRSEKAATFLMNTIGYYKYTLSFNLYCFCIMPEHLHMIIQPCLKKYNISFIMQSIKGSFAITYNRMIRKNGAVWQKRFYDEAIRTEEDLLIKINYTLQNPVRARMVGEASDYRFSSARVYYRNEYDRLTDRYNQII